MRVICRRARMGRSPTQDRTFLETDLALNLIQARYLHNVWPNDGSIFHILCQVLSYHAFWNLYPPCGKPKFKAPKLNLKSEIERYYFLRNIGRQFTWRKVLSDDTTLFFVEPRRKSPVDLQWGATQCSNYNININIHIERNVWCNWGRISYDYKRDLGLNPDLEFYVLWFLCASVVWTENWTGHFAR